MTSFYFCVGPCSVSTPRIRPSTVLVLSSSPSLVRNSPHLSLFAPRSPQRLQLVFRQHRFLLLCFAQLHQHWFCCQLMLLVSNEYVDHLVVHGIRNLGAVPCASRLVCVSSFEVLREEATNFITLGAGEGRNAVRGTDEDMLGGRICLQQGPHHFHVVIERSPDQCGTSSHEADVDAVGDQLADLGQVRLVV